MEMKVKEKANLTVIKQAICAWFLHGYRRAWSV